MNIQEAKKEIKNTLRAYLRKNEQGEYVYNQVHQRPILLMGPPGIGKTAIMRQIAIESGVGLVAYTITHHTRQSAVGLPEIVTRKYRDRELTVTEYTMSEIVSAVYDCMERTGKAEGILFIDEINCVSETLAPAMLGLLQNKTFGSHRIPEGWVLVAAGNPPQYNKSVREFDVVTLDRVRKIEIEADYDAWMKYAWEQNVHGAVLSYLSMKKDRFYCVEKTAEGTSFVTARGWEDLSELLKSYEVLGVDIDKNLVIQFLQKEETAREFAVYYRLYHKYGTDYGIPELLAGVSDSHTYHEKKEMASKGSFEERFTVVNLVAAALNLLAAEFDRKNREVHALYSMLFCLKNNLSGKDELSAVGEFLENQRKSLQVKVQGELISSEEKEIQEKTIRKIDAYYLALRESHVTGCADGMERIKTFFAGETEELDELEKKLSEKLNRGFAFLKDAFGDGQEMVLFVTELTASRYLSGFIADYGCDPYFYYSEKLLFGKQEKMLRDACRELLG